MDNDRSAPGTRGDLCDLKQEIAMWRSEMRCSFELLTNIMRDGHKDLIKLFDGCAQNNRERVQTAKSETASLEKRVSIVEARITDVERRLMTPPPQ